LNKQFTSQQRVLSLSTVSQAVALTLAGVTGAYAQTAPAPAPTASEAAKAEEAKRLSTIVVRGIRKGIEDAISVKKNADSIVESIAAEDIGKLPDSSIAESIARLPGVAAQRVNGRATEISIRGLSGDFANTLLNGREQTSTGNNRSVQFDQYPSELLAGVQIYKTPTSSLVGQGLSGTINLETVRPLNFPGRTINLNLRGEKSGLGTDFTGTGTRFNATYIDQFADRTIGVAVGFARLAQKRETFREEKYGENDEADFANVNGGAKFRFNQGFKYFVDDADETRDAFAGTLEFRPNKEMTHTLDVFYSKFDKEFTKRGIEAQMNDSWKGAGNPQAAQLTNATVTNGRLVSGTWLNVNPLRRTIWEPRQDELNSVGWNSKWKFAPNWTGTVDLNYSTAKSKEQIAEMEAGLWNNTTNARQSETVTVSNYNQITGLSFPAGTNTSIRLTDPEGWGQNGYNKTITTNDKIKAIRVSAARDMDGFFSKIDAGLNYTQRDKTKGSIEEFLRLPAGNTTGTPLPSSATTISLGSSGLSTVSFDPALIYPSAYRLDPNVNGDILRKGWEVNEKITTGFLRADIDTELGGFGLRGNAGVQIVRSDQSSTAPAVDNAQQSSFSLRTLGKTYTDVLPTMNLALDVGSDQIVRFGLGKQMARARMDQLTAFTRSEVSPGALSAQQQATCPAGQTCGKWTGSGGNPLLDPFRATAFDISYEKYFGNKGYVSAAYFHKDLESYIFDLTDKAFNFTGFPNLTGRTPLSNIGEFSRPVNGKGGVIKGLELAVNVPLSLATPVLDGFGVQFSFSDTQSKVRPFGDNDVRPLPGLSRKVQTFTAYYEKHGFSARISTRDRSPFISEISGFGGDREYRYARAEQITDVQFGYDFNSGALKGLSLLLQVNNASNEPYREYDPSNPTVDTKKDTYGRTVLFGASYKF
jgi:iron complex outermembrane recepter protein